jgi:hypothetical protein
MTFGHPAIQLYNRIAAARRNERAE